MDKKIKIPKWVSEILDEFLKESDYYNWYDFEMADMFLNDEIDGDDLETKFISWTNSKNATEITLAYLNPLTRQFVEVSDD